MNANFQTASILVVDDEREICEILSEYFTDRGYDITTAHDAVAARHQFKLNKPDLAILDIRMPGEDGLSLARWIRQQHPGTGIIMLTTAADVIDRIVGLEMGADDYVPKPFDLRELQARVKSLLRRLAEETKTPTNENRTRFGLCELDLVTRQLFDPKGEEQTLTSMEFDLLKVFADHPNHALSRDRIMEFAHNRGWDVFDRSIDLRIMRLRKKIEQNPEKPEVIKTVRGVGYMYVKQ